METKNKELPDEMKIKIAQSHKTKMCYNCGRKSGTTTGIVGGKVLFKCVDCRQKYIRDREIYGGVNHANFPVKVSKVPRRKIKY